MIDKELLEKYREAGRVLSVALEKGKEKVQPGVKLLDITRYIEEELIKKKGYSPAFPLNIGINEITAHYSCPREDPSTVPDECLIKLDMGVHIDGCTTDMAISVQVGTDIYQKLIDAAEAGLRTAIKTIKAGVFVSEVATKVEEAIRSFGVQPISNLSGHMMKVYQLHGGVSVPSVKCRDPSNNYQFQLGDIFAIEPFTTIKSAAGFVKNSPEVYIYSLLKRKIKNCPTKVTRIVNKIWGERRHLPFAMRWYNPIPAPIINRLKNQQVLQGYPVLIEASNNPVAQAEKTLVVLKNHCEILT
ncbi:MAG: type II methionyl aminopeptidase [Candidatus Helarchaeota archaeon]